LSAARQKTNGADDMTIVLQWWWGLPLVIALASLIFDLFQAAFSWIDFPWSFIAWPFAAGILLGHFL
jgi:hypothetical protein